VYHLLKVDDDFRQLPNPSKDLFRGKQRAPKKGIQVPTQSKLINEIIQWALRGRGGLVSHAPFAMAYLSLLRLCVENI